MKFFTRCISLLAAVMLMSVSSLFAQNVTVRGVVVNNDGDPLIGAAGQLCDHLVGLTLILLLLQTDSRLLCAAGDQLHRILGSDVLKVAKFFTLKRSTRGR